jgi:hypothetical protein
MLIGKHEHVTVQEGLVDRGKRLVVEGLAEIDSGDGGSERG